MKIASPKLKSTNQRLAAIYGTAERQIGRWKAAGAPLFNVRGMMTFFAGQRSFPKHIAALSADRRAEMQSLLDALEPPSGAAAGSEANAATDDDASTLDGGDTDILPAGAEHELRWLADLAVEARRNLIRAQKCGNALVQKQALSDYLKISEGLLRYDRSVDPKRRDGTEVVTKAQIESVLSGVIVWVRRGIEDYLNGRCLAIAECDSPQEIYAIIAEPLRGCLAQALNASMESQTKTPGWVRDAMVKAL